MRKYKSKYDPGLTILLFAILGLLSVLMIYQKVWTGLAIMLLTALFILHLFNSTYYVIAGPILQIKSSILINETIAIDSIFRISESHSILAAPAASLDRLKIEYKGGMTLVSPKDKEGFLTDLLSVNQEIEVIPKT